MPPKLYVPMFRCLALFSVKDNRFGHTKMFSLIELVTACKPKSGFWDTVKVDVKKIMSNIKILRYS